MTGVSAFRRIRRLFLSAGAKLHRRSTLLRIDELSDSHLADLGLRRSDMSNGDGTFWHWHGMR